jgi:hypothetical protein
MSKSTTRSLAAVFMACLTACTVGDDTRVVSADEPLPDDLIAGDVVRRSAIEVVVPEPGEEVIMVAELDDGSSIELAVRHPLGGAVELIEPMIEPLVIAAGSTAQCDDGANNVYGYKWRVRYDWSFQAGSTPSANSKDNVEQGLQNAASAITHSRNDCGLADQVSATQQYLGRTATAPNIRNAEGVATCTPGDRKNVAGFGSLPTGMLGTACTTVAAGGLVAIEGDIMLSARRAWFALDVPTDCANRYGVQPAATHELGHVFGLAHVSESAHPNLTMSTVAKSCTNAPLTLGLGDVRGLRALY